MFRLSANLTFLFTELPMLDRFAAAKRAGFQGIEILFPYDLAAPSLAKAAEDAGLDIVLLNAPPPNWAGGPRGFCAEPGAEQRFRKDFDRSLRYAQVLGARHMHLMAGRAEGEAARQTYIRNLIWAADRAPHASLTIEPLNPVDMPGYFLNDFDLAADILAEVDRPNVSLQFDSYHAHMLTGDVVGTWMRFQHLVRHVQVSNAPGRHEPDRGEIDHQAFFAALRETAYSGWVSAEYTPSGPTETGLGWMHRI